MAYKWYYETPKQFDNIVMTSDGECLTGLWFMNSRDSAAAKLDCREKNVNGFRDTAKWLDKYFSGIVPDFTPKYRVEGITPFRIEVIKEMLKIPFGALSTYGRIAEEIAEHRGIERMSSRAVGGAVGWNPISIIIPCHRVVGSNHALTGYGGGIGNKIELLRLEGHTVNGSIVSEQKGEKWT